MIKPSDYNLISSLDHSEMQHFTEALEVSVEIADIVDKGMLANAKKRKRGNKKRKKK